VPTSPALRQMLAVNTRLTAPVVSEFWWRYQGRINLFCGLEFNAEPAAGLNGYCDPIIRLAPRRRSWSPL
jgi:hypothetical protein